METKKEYFEKTDIIVKNLLAELYESESDTQKDIIETKEKFSAKLSELQEKYNETLKKREELEYKYKELKDESEEDWENLKYKFDLLLEYLEGDRHSFIEKAEATLVDLGNKIVSLEDEASTAAKDVKISLIEKVEALKDSKKELEIKIEAVKNDTSHKWQDIKHWFIEKSNSVKEYISSN